MDKKTIFLILLIIFSLKFFDAVIAQTGMFKNLTFGFMVVAILVSIPYVFKNRGGFVLPAQLISVSVFISIFMAKYTWGQGFQYMPSTIPFLIWFVFFYLLELEIPIKKIENVILGYGVLYVILFLFQFTHNSVVYFGYVEEFLENRGVIRVNFPGAGVFFLSCFIAINRVTSDTGKLRYVWLIYALSGIVIIVMQVIRQEIVLLLFFYMIHFLRNVKLPYKVVTIAVFVLAGYAFINSGSSISKGLADQQKEDASAGKDYIRIVAAEYFLTQFTPNTVSKIFGNGFYNETSGYGKVMSALQTNYGYYTTDVGLVEVYVIFGIFAILGYLIIFIKSFTIPLPNKYYYLKYYLWMVMLTSLTSDNLISNKFLITTVITLACYQRISKQSFEEDEEETDADEFTEVAIIG